MIKTAFTSVQDNKTPRLKNVVIDLDPNSNKSPLSNKKRSMLLSPS